MHAKHAGFYPQRTGFRLGSDGSAHCAGLTPVAEVLGSACSNITFVLDRNLLCASYNGNVVRYFLVDPPFPAVANHTYDTL